MHDHGHSGDSSAHPGTGGPGHGRDYDRTPLILTWEVTQACGLTCDHCRAEAQEERHPDELTTAEGEALIDDVASFGDPGPILVLSGGDPLERPDLFHLVEYATAQGIPTCVTPAPTDNLDRETVAQLADAGVRRIALSLDGATAAAHDGFRGEEGSYEAVFRTARQAREVGLPIQINTTVTAATVDSLPDIADIVADLGAAMWEVFFLVPVGNGTDLEPLSPPASVELMEWLYERQRGAPFRLITVEAPHYRVVAQQVDSDARVGSTRAGRGFLFVSHTGEVYPSGFLPRSAGSVREASVVDVYRESQLLRSLRDADGFAGRCGTCPHRSVCGGSRSRAYAAHGDALASDPLCPGPERIASLVG
ncbi:MULTISPECIES: radical SAM protein [Salinibaculum]|uniref:radical SAM protein n=1 Tax=Salinibaculum TaxID=2732368 RepID=UPI0030CDCC8D